MTNAVSDRPRTIEREAAASSSRAALLVLLASLGVFLAADDQTSVVAILPKMIDGIGLPQDQFYKAAWIVNGYILGYVVAMPLMGRVSDIFGHGRIFALSLAIFVTGSVGVALSTNLTMVAIARAVQALGGGAVVPVAMAIVADAMPAERRVIGIGSMAAASEGGGLIGPLWGGGLAQLIGWRGVFWLHLPLCLPIAAAVWMLSHQRSGSSGRSLDVVGAGLFGASLVCLTVALTDDPISPRPHPVTWLLYASALLLFLLFLVRQLQASDPLVDLAIFRRKPLWSGFVATGLLGGVAIVAMVNVPLFTNVILHGSALDGGLNLMRMTIAVPVGAAAGGFLAMKLGFSRTTISGIVLTGVAFLSMSRWTADPGQAILTLPLLVGGLGLGLIIAPLGTAVMNEVPEVRRASTSSLLTVTDMLGALIGVALLTTRGLGGFYAEAGLIPLDDPRYGQLVRGLEIGSFQDTFLVAALVCFAALIPAALLGSGPGRKLTWREIWPIH